MYHMTTMVDNTIKLKFAKEVEIKCSYQKKKKKGDMWGNICINELDWESFHSVHAYQIIMLYT